MQPKYWIQDVKCAFASMSKVWSLVWIVCGPVIWQIQATLPRWSIVTLWVLNSHFSKVDNSDEFTTAFLSRQPFLKYEPNRGNKGTRTQLWWYSTGSKITKRRSFCVSLPLVSEFQWNSEDFRGHGQLRLQPTESPFTNHSDEESYLLGKNLKFLLVEQIFSTRHGRSQHTVHRELSHFKFGCSQQWCRCLCRY